MKTFWIATTTAFLVSSCHGLSSTTTSTSSSANNHPTVSLQTLQQSQLAIFDGAEWASVQMILKEQGDLPKSTVYGYCKVVTGRNAQKERVVALQATTSTNTDENDNSSVVFESSIAKIPDKVSDPDAISTYIISLSAIHCALPKVQDVGGGGDSLIAGKAVILGSNDLACFAAQGLASLGVQVSLVTTNSPKIDAPNVGTKINILKPGVGEDQEGFASVIGEFDTLLDTAFDERGDKSFIEEETTTLLYGGSVLDLLKSRHNCNRYVSTMTQSQRIIRENGVMFGPGKADDYAKKLDAGSFLTSPDVQPMPPLADLGWTMQSLLDNGIVFTEQQRKKMYSKSNKSVKGWSLSDFWEQSTWPRDSNGGANTRFGLPTKDDPDLDDDYMILEAPLRRLDNRKYVPDDDMEDEDLKTSPLAAAAAAQKNPYVQDVIGVRGLEEDVMAQKKDCLMFLSAKFCKTCKTLNPQFTRMARVAKEQDSSISFVKAEASGPLGKPLGKFLEIDAVPSFILYRQGQRFGIPLSVSRLPSDKINRALELLKSGQEWDDSILEEEF